MTYHLVAGQTGDQDFQLLENDEPLAASIQGMPVALVLRDNREQLVDVVGDVLNLDDGTPEKRGFVRVNLDAVDVRFDRSPYKARWKVTDSGKANLWPSGDADIWIVGRGEA